MSSARASEAETTEINNHIERCIANIKLRNFDDALKDAETATTLAFQYQDRFLMATAQYRRAISFFHLGQYGNAKFSLSLAKTVNYRIPGPPDTLRFVINTDEYHADLDQARELGRRLDSWETMITNKLNALPANDTNRSVTVYEIPGREGVSSNIPPPEFEAKSVVTTHPSRITHRWHQDDDTVYVSLIVSGVPRNDFESDIDSWEISITFRLPNGGYYFFKVSPLFAKIEGALSTIEVLETQVDFHLKKTESGNTWQTLGTIECGAYDCVFRDTD